MNKKLSLVESAELDRQRALDKVHIGKQFPDAAEVKIDGETCFISDAVSLDNYDDLVFYTERAPGMSQTAVSLRLVLNAKRRPGRDPISVYSRKVYGLHINHLVRLAEILPANVVIDGLEKVLKIQEKTR